MNEQVFQFGPSKSLTGVLTKPAVVDNEKPTALIFNAGIIHRSGPFRLHVDIARELARQGFSTFRIDLSGLGDSRVRTEIQSDEDRAILDARDAMEFLQSETDCSRFVVMGLCSGAYNAHQIAVADERVVGGVFLDGLVFRTTGFYLRHYGLRLTRFRFWRNALKRRLVDGVMEPSDADGPGAAEFFETDKSAEQVSDEIQSMIDRDVQLLFAYTEGYDDISSRSQFFEMFGLVPGSDQLQVDYYKNFEHTFRLTDHRRVISERIGNWFADRFAAQKLSGLVTQ